MSCFQNLYHFEGDISIRTNQQIKKYRDTQHKYIYIYTYMLLYIELEREREIDIYVMMSSQCIVPNWNLRQQRQEEQVEVEGEERNRSPHVQSHQNLSYVVPMCNNEVTELTWQNGQISVHGVGEASCKPQTWGLESIVHQATATFNATAYPQPYSSTSSMPIGKWDLQQDGNSSSSRMHADQQIDRGSFKASSKRVRSEPAKGFPAEESASATFCRDRDTDTTMMTWNSFESPSSLKSTRIADDDSVYLDCSENQDGERITKGESCRSQSSARRSRAAAIHNLSERRRRDRINEKMKALQKLVPNASKTDKASMLDEVIEYLKQLQAQVNMMSNARNMPQMVMPMGMQQQLQMSLLARMGMGMGMGMGMLDVNNLARNVHPSFPPLVHAAAATPFVSPPFAMPSVVPPPKPNVDASAPVPNFNDAYNTFLAQSMNMEFLNKMSALYRQQSSSQQPSKKPVSLSLPNDARGG